MAITLDDYDFSDLKNYPNVGILPDGTVVECSFNGNGLLRPANIQFPYTQEAINEIEKCKNDKMYFFETYCRVTTLDDGVRTVTLRDYQHEFIEILEDNRFVVAKMGRQMGKTVTTSMYIVWHLVFMKEFNIGIIGNTDDVVKENVSKIKEIYELLPPFLQIGIRAWNTKGVRLSNGNKIYSAVAGPNSLVGKSINMVFLDEVGKIDDRKAKQMYDSVMPTLSSGSKTRIVQTSTPLGYNHFYELWKGAVNGENGYAFMEAKWDRVPWRDEDWKQREIARDGLEAFMQNHECVTGETKVNVLYNGTEETLRIDALYRMVEEDPHVNVKVKTPSGWSDFNGIKATKQKRTIITLKFNRGQIRVTEDHLVKTDHGFIEAQNLEIGQKVIAKDGYVYVEDASGEETYEFVYDILDVEMKHEYFTNDIVSHNCSFIGSSNTLLSAETLEKLKVREPLQGNYGIPELKVYEQPKSGATYVMGVDTAKTTGTGSDGDFICFQVLRIDYDRKKLIQCASFRGQDFHYLDSADYASQIGKLYNNAFMIVENNSGDGQSIADQLFENYEYENIYTDERGVNGFRTTRKTKKVGLMNLKKLIESGKLVLRNEDTINEFFTFIKKKTSYEASSGNHDDCIMSLMMATAFFQIDGGEIELEINDMFSSEKLVAPESGEDDRTDDDLDIVLTSNSEENWDLV